MIKTRTGIVDPGPQKDFPPSIIIWNGNGVRARWTAPNNELKALVESTNPDLLCFIESKADAQKMLGLKGFEEWIDEKGFKHEFCYWSTHADKTAHGGEGIMICSKIPCVVEYGMVHEEFDKQARVATIIFPAIIIVISYNPQGGFVEKSLEFRKRWEEAFTKFLSTLRTRAAREGKPILWGGDLNVCPHDDDWSERAFDHIRHKIQQGKIAMGCRKEDQIAYCKMLKAIEGTNVADELAWNNRKRTCFPNEPSLKKNFGQRLDHVIAQNGLLNGEARVAVLDFDVVQQFGGGRKFCSDHCPLWVRLDNKDEKEERTRTQKEVEVCMMDMELVEEIQVLTAKYFPEDKEKGEETQSHMSSPMSIAFVENEEEEDFKADEDTMAIHRGFDAEEE